MILKDIQADASVGVDVRVVDLGGELDFGWLEGVVGGELDVELEYTSSIRRSFLKWGKIQRENGRRKEMSMGGDGWLTKWLTGPKMVASHSNRLLSCLGPALHEVGGSRAMSASSCKNERTKD